MTINRHPERLPRRHLHRHPVVVARSTGWRSCVSALWVGCDAALSEDGSCRAKPGLQLAIATWHSQGIDGDAKSFYSDVRLAEI